ncbi:hypothetical protein QJS04_geneDACA023025 [Acorus gramineus]|uniref:Uncharacterized protein n=1 Tax=Acorus gramineus TaxID=55184 RepID=A0AAV9BXJ5_ACOGR|nr:hypothetical protein QJS04_geneDACA023025 [Acorus gramineus]
MRTREMPRVFRPPIWFTLTVVTFDPILWLVLPGLFRPEKKKSLASTFMGSCKQIHSPAL